MAVRVDDSQQVLAVALPPYVVELQEAPAGVLLREIPMACGLPQDVPELSQQVGFPGGRRRIELAQAYQLRRRLGVGIDRDDVGGEVGEI
jgi:hypothetical protein